MGIDKQLYKLPLLGPILKRLYSYFKTHIAFTDFIHISLGIGVGLIIAGNKFFVWGISLFIIGILGHLYAYIKGDSGPS